MIKWKQKINNIAWVHAVNKIKKYSYRNSAVNNSLDGYKYVSSKRK